VFRLEPLTDGEVRGIVESALADERGFAGRVQLGEEALNHLVDLSGGDARAALNVLESAAAMAAQPTLDDIEAAAQQRVLAYDRAGDGHYDTVSAFIKSLRGNDPDAALYWLAAMVAAGEDPRFIARRLIVAASEDVGNADPRALQVAVAAAYALDWVGLPEAQYALAQATAFIATAPKSNRAGSGYWAAAADVQEFGSLPVPKPLRSGTWREKRDFGIGAHYVYPHDYEGADVEQQYLPDRLAKLKRRYYEPSEEGYERTIGERMASRQAAREAAAQAGGPTRMRGAGGKGGGMKLGDNVMRSREEAKRATAERQKREASGS
jgi:putative ATPase